MIAVLLILRVVVGALRFIQSCVFEWEISSSNILDRETHQQQPCSMPPYVNVNNRSGSETAESECRIQVHRVRVH
jgi:hypothetical protein